MATPAKAKDSSKEITDYKNKLESALKKLQTELDVEEGVQKVKGEALGAKGLDALSAGLSEQLGKWLRQAKIAVSTVSEINSVMENSTLPSETLKKETEAVLKDLADKHKRKADSFRQQLGSCNAKRRLDLEIMLHFAELYEHLMRDMYLPNLQDIYERKKKKEEEEADESASAEHEHHRTDCGATCKDGHPCHHTVWDGWICWQHGGGQWSQGTGTAGIPA